MNAYSVNLVMIVCIVRIVRTVVIVSAYGIVQTVRTVCSRAIYAINDLFFATHSSRNMNIEKNTVSSWLLSGKIVSHEPA